MISSALGKQVYVVIEPQDGPPIMGADWYICPWEDFPSRLSDYVEEAIEIGQSGLVQLKVLEFTSDEYGAFCAEHDIEG